MKPIKEWFKYYWDELAIGIGTTAFIVAVILVGWHIFQTTPSSLKEGTVVDHKFTAQYEEDHDGGTTCWSRDKNGVCTFQTQNADIHHVHCRGGCYEIQIDGCSNDRRGVAHCRKEWKTVERLTYEDCENGSNWIKNNLKCALR